MNEQKVEKLINLLGTKYSTILNFNSTSSDFQTTFPTPLILNNEYNYEIGLTWFTTFNNIFNINESNNVFQFMYMGIKYNLTITPCVYELDVLFSEMRKLIKNVISNKIQNLISQISDEHNKWLNELKETNKEVSSIDFKVNMATAKIDCFIFKGQPSASGQSPDFKFYPGTLSKVLGFTKENYIANCISENCVNISNITSINLICDLIEETYQDRKRNNCLYNFPYGSVPHRYRIVNFINSPIYLPIIKKTIDSI